MVAHWTRSRITKALTDASRAASFSEAEARLDSVYINVIVGHDQITTAAGQAATLTAVATAYKCFGHIVLVAEIDAPLIASIPLGKTLVEAARCLGASIATNPTPDITHAIRVGDVPQTSVWDVRCWWDRWLTGTRAFDGDFLGDSRLALAGISLVPPRYGKCLHPSSRAKIFRPATPHSLYGRRGLPLIFLKLVPDASTFLTSCGSSAWDISAKPSFGVCR